MDFEPLTSRRGLIAGLGALTLAGCGPKAQKAETPAPAAPAGPPSLDKVIAGEWRSPADKARDAWRHPAESLAFWGLKPGMTVVEFWPGAGWYTDILAPFLDQTGGKLYIANFDANDPAEAQIAAALQQKIEGNRRVYGRVEFTTFGPMSGPAAPAASADMVLFLRNVHNWMAGGIAEKAFRDAFAALKPGGVLGVEEHRGVPGGVQDMVASNGYVQEAFVKQLASEAGFKFDKASEINANPADTKDHPFGVWTLPPVRRSSPRGQPDNPAFDRAKYDAIGESDRMTLRFVKPA